MSQCVCTNICDFLGNLDQKNIFNNFIFSKHDKIVLVSGVMGSGKTVFIRLNCEHAQIQHKFLSFENSSNHSEFLTICEKALLQKSILDILGNKPSLFIIDNVDILYNQDKLFAKSLIKFLQTLKTRPLNKKLVLVVSCNDLKKIQDLINNVDVHIRLDTPSASECHQFIKRRFGDSLSNKDIDHIISINKNSINNIINHIEIGSHQTNKSLLHLKFRDLSIYQVVENLFGLNVHDAISIIENIPGYDPILLSLLMYDNMNVYLRRNNARFTSLKSYGDLAECYNNAYILENNAYSSHDTYITCIGNLLKVGGIVKIVSSSKKKQTKHEKQKDHDYKCTETYKFTQILTKTALFHNVKKKCHKVFHQLNIDPHYMMVVADMTPLTKKRQYKSNHIELSSLINNFNNFVSH